jgi:energy-coupling factor transporter ATP-binding protein EcfA2
MMKFIDLNRQFIDITDTDAEEAAIRSYTKRIFGHADDSWDKLLKSRIIVILGEAGSGKTKELKNQTRILKARNENAFFIPLNDLIDSQLSTVLLPEDERAFRGLNGNSGIITFFLDSVDEAKFRKIGDFERTFNNFIRGIDHIKGHVRFI